jgi:probable O-glycosylation ligase (exosortase A-associated)
MYEYQLDWWRPERVDTALPSEAPSVPFWALMAFTAVLLFSPQAYVPILASVRPALLTIAFGILTYLAERWAKRRPVIEWNRESRLIAGLVGLAAVTVPFSIWPGGSLSVLSDFLKTAVIFLLLSHVVTTLDRLHRAAWFLTWMAMGLGLFAIYNFATGAFVDQGVNNDRLVGNEGALTKNPNDLALMINLLLPLTVALLLTSREPWHRGVLLVAIGMEGMTVVLTHSRAGALTLGVIVLAYVWKLRGTRGRSWLYVMLFAGVLAIPFLPSSYLARMGTITNVQADRTGSARERLSDMIIATRTIVDHPVVGAGIGMNMLAMREERGGWLRVHNVYLEHAIELGLPGLALFLALLVSCLRSAGSIQRSDVPPELSSLAQGLQISLIAYAVAAMFHPVSYQYYFYYIAGLTIGAKTIADARVVRRAEVTA